MKTQQTKLSGFIKIHIFIFFKLCFGINQSVSAQCPTINENVQTFCDNESILISDLQATDNGGGIVWYDTPTSTTPYSPTEGLIDGEDYYADDSTGSCGTRERVDVVIYSAPLGSPFQGVCVEDLADATLEDLTAIGNDVQWYNTPSGGSPLPLTTQIFDDSFYYADQLNPVTGCRTSRLSVLVQVGYVPTPTGDSQQTFCNDPNNPPTISDIVVSGSVRWYNTNVSNTPLDPNTLLSNNEDYYATTVDPPCESSQRFRVFIKLDPINNPGENGEILICETDISSGFVKLKDGLGGNPDNNGEWTGPFPTTGGGNGNLDTSLMTVDGSPYVFTYTVEKQNSVCPPTSATVSVIIVAEPNAGENATLEICSNDAPVNLFQLLGGAPESGGTWTPALNSGGNIFDPSIDSSGDYTYEVTGTPPCGPATSIVSVTVYQEPDAGENGSIDICSNGTPINLFDYLGGTPETGGTWSPVLASGTGIFDPTIDVGGTYTYTVIGNGPCDPDIAEVEVNIIPEPNSGEDGSAEICSNDAPIDLFTLLNGTPDTGGTWTPSLDSGTGIFDPSIDSSGIYTYTVSGTGPCEDASSNVTITIIQEPNSGIDGSIDLCTNDSSLDLFTILGGSPDTGGSWSPTLTSGSGVFDPLVDSAGTYTYTVEGIDPCGPSSSSVVVTLIPEPNAGENASIEICSNDSTVDLFTLLGGTPESGGTWTPELASGSGIFNPEVDSAGDYTYTVNGTGPCSDATSIVSITIIQQPNPGMDGSVEVCSNGPSVDLFDSLGGSPDSGGTWSPALSSGTGIFDPAVDAAGTYTYTVDGSGPCGPETSEVSVTIVDEPDAGTDGTLEICSNDSAFDLTASLGGTPDPGGSWSPALASGTNLFDPAIDSAGDYTYTVSGNGPCPDASATVSVAVVQKPDAGTNGNLTICSSADAVNLFDYLGGSPDTGGMWSPALASGTGEFDPAVDAAGTYTYTVNGTGPCADESAEVSVTIVDQLDAGEDGTLEICSNDSPIDLFDSLGGNPDAGGAWTPALASGSGIFDPAVDIEGTYTYTIAADGDCNEVSAQVVVAVAQEPNPGMDGSVEVCSNGPSVDLFDSLGGSPDSGGTWSPALSSGTGIFDPAVDAAGTYTYTVDGSGPCGPETSEVSVTIADEPDAGTDGTLEICSNDSAFDLTASLGGTPDPGGSWSPALASGTNLFDPAIDSAGDYTYTVSGNGPCPDASATVSVAVVQKPDAGTNGNLTICSSADAVNLFDYLGGSPDTGGIWSPALASGTGEFNPAIDTAETYTYTVNGTGPCADESAEVSVTIVDQLDAGEDGTLEICSNDSPIDLFDSLGGNPDTGGAWTPALASGSGIFDPAVDSSGDYIYTLSGNGSCPDVSSMVTVTKLEGPNAGNDTTLEICNDGSTQDLFLLLGDDAQVGGTWSPALTSGSGVFDPAVDSEGDYTYTVLTNGNCNIQDEATVTVVFVGEPNLDGATLTIGAPCLGTDGFAAISGASSLPDGEYIIDYILTDSNEIDNSSTAVFTNGQGTFTIPHTDIPNSGNTILTVIGITSVSSNCSSIVLDLEEVEFNVIEVPTPEIIEGGNEFCSFDDPTIASLSGNLVDSQSVVWYDTAEGGTILSENESLIDGRTYYGVYNLKTCESFQRLVVTVSVLDCEKLLIIPDGFSPNGDGINDNFTIVNLREYYPNFNLKIFNRYGNWLYTGNINKDDWDGRSDADSTLGSGTAPTGVYFYILDFNDGERKTKQGRVYLSR
ncbi:gliding motility-associated C-terminal domain-containing protein [Aegicerativicinus sediminis]|uniref:gliding motility-associated C-terminal domain-containing protein n=1 Tax=Aegicerativicinus sediminis TaxID=2893202 RepID=UPI001E5E94F8|nr:gliding motility-associated C-terminal domain-containing protein [Aegicerativicinus sediminis]